MSEKKPLDAPDAVEFVVSSLDVSGMAATGGVAGAMRVRINMMVSTNRYLHLW